MIKKLLLSVLAIFGFALVGVSSANAASWTSPDTYVRSNASSWTELDTSAVDFDVKYYEVEFLGANPTNSTASIGYMYTSQKWSYGSSGSLYGTFQEGFKQSVCFPSPVSGYSFGYRYYGGTSVGFRATFYDTCPSFSGINPTGTLNITENGTFDVTNYASAVVNVDQTISDLPPYSELVVDSFWKYHVAIAGGLASIFAVFVVYRIIRSRLR